MFEHGVVVTQPIPQGVTGVLCLSGRGGVEDLAPPLPDAFLHAEKTGLYSDSDDPVVFVEQRDVDLIRPIMCHDVKPGDDVP